MCFAAEVSPGERFAAADRKTFAASHEEGSNKVVGVLFLPLHTLNMPHREVETVATDDTRTGTLLSGNDLAAAPSHPATETVMFCGLSGVAGVEGESCTGGRSSLVVKESSCRLIGTKARPYPCAPCNLNSKDKSLLRARPGDQQDL